MSARKYLENRYPSILPQLFTSTHNSFSLVQRQRSRLCFNILIVPRSAIFADTATGLDAPVAWPFTLTTNI